MWVCHNLLNAPTMLLQRFIARCLPLIWVKLTALNRSCSADVFYYHFLNPICFAFTIYMYTYVIHTIAYIHSPHNLSTRAVTYTILGFDGKPLINITGGWWHIIIWNFNAGPLTWFSHAVSGFGRTYFNNKFQIWPFKVNTGQWCGMVSEMFGLKQVSFRINITVRV